ncbi:dihydropteroate synthase [Palleronia caenipelagi]|uniref:Dihydropteroate synthase n=1 Tax=Palleronia caenipelagi TaxID=2489174 RepID=A0A547PN33_9RHOB|nr:dihydropteroate synthase [Palleronia caenipelagi]TRD15515.1 dihydropteroate synthase [Palleronia caenipelagi]
MIYYRPLAQTGPHRPAEALTLAGGSCWFTHVLRLSRDITPEVLPAKALPEPWYDRLTDNRTALAGLRMDRPQIMGILNTTPDSFSDGGLHAGLDDAVAGAERLIAEGATILDIGGESTRPGAKEVPMAEEIARTDPVIRAIRENWDGPISIDTRKAPVARAAVGAGASLLNDVSAMTFDPEMVTVAAGSGAPICLMHAQGDPQTMQDDPRYDDALLDIYDWLEARIIVAENAGINRDRIIVDPGIGFGKTVAHNLHLLNGISLFHGLGCAILLGASRKRFIGTITGVENAAARMPGSVAVALAAAAQGVQILRVHDVAETSQALRLWRASITGEYP